MASATDSSAFAALREAAERAEKAWATYEASVTTTENLRLEAVSAAEAVAALRPAGRQARVRTRQAMTDEFLEEVSLAYRTAEDAGRNPVEALITRYNKPYPTIARWISETRKRGFLERIPQNG